MGRLQVGSALANRLPGALEVFGCQDQGHLRDVQDSGGDRKLFVWQIGGPRHLVSVLA
jgi:hypothetical protein